MSQPDVCNEPAPGQALQCQRHLFSIPAEHCWLNAAYMGPLPVPVQEAGVQAIRQRAFPLAIKPDDFFSPAERVRQLFGQLVNADPESIAIIPTTAYGTAIVAANMSPRAGQNVVMLAEQFPSNVHPWKTWVEHGVEMRFVSPPDGPWAASESEASRTTRWNDALIAAIDGNTALVTIEQAHWADGSLFDLVRIGECCRAVGAVYVIDATQTAATMILDCRRIRPDALIVHSYKAMLCNYGLGFVVLSNQFANGKPLENSWLMRAGSDDFSRLLPYQEEYAAGMRRFDSSLRGNPSLIGMLEVSCRLLLQWQPDRIRQYLLGIERQFVDRVRGLGFQVADEADRAANVFGLALPGGMDSRAVASALAEKNIHVSVRGPAIRVSPHVYNDESDLMKLADALQTLV